jgi:hypothetical protein
VSAGPFIRASIKNSSGERAGLGQTVSGRFVTLTIDIESPEWAWFDTVEIFANTEPVPADDDKHIPIEGKAADPAEFFAPYHIPRYYYKPQYSFSLKEKNLDSWKNEDGVIRAHIELEMELNKDTWVVVFARGTEDTEGYRSLFPFVTRALVDADNPSVEAEEADIGNIDMLALTGAPAWAFTNPIFVDVDGGGFDALYTKDWGDADSKQESVSATKANTKLILKLLGNP